MARTKLTTFNRLPLIHQLAVASRVTNFPNLKELAVTLTERNPVISYTSRNRLRIMEDGDIFALTPDPRVTVKNSA